MALCVCGELMNACGMMDTSPIFKAVREDDVEEVKQMVMEQGLSTEQQGALLLTACSFEGGTSNVARYLVRRGALKGIDMSRTDKKRMAQKIPITVAAEFNNWEVVRVLINDGGEKAYAFDKYGWSALSWASTFAFCLFGPAAPPPIHFLKELLWDDENREHINDEHYETGMTVLSVAGAHAVPLLAEAGADVNYINALGQTPLWIACVEGKGPKVEQLLLAGADPSLRGGCEGNGTPLLAAVLKLGPDSLRLLTSHPGCALGAVDEDGNSALDLACRGGRLEVVEVLLEVGRTTHRHHEWNLTSALVQAVAGDHVDIIRHLVLEGGADVNGVEKEGKERVCTLAAFLGKWDVLDVLVELGADLRLCSEWLLLHAAERAPDEVTVRLIQAGCPLRKPSEGLTTTLHAAIQSCHYGAMRALVEAGEPVDFPDSSGKTALMLVAQCKIRGTTDEALEAVKYLVEQAGANVCARVGKQGTMAVDLAAANGADRMVAYLKEAFKLAEEKAAAAAAALLEEEDTAVAGKEASTKKKKKKGKKKGGAAVPTQSCQQEQQPTSNIEPSEPETNDHAEAIAAALLSLEVGGEDAYLDVKGMRDLNARLCETPEQCAVGHVEMQDALEKSNSGTQKNSSLAAASREDEEDSARHVMVPLDGLSCPISLQLMTEAVVADDGHTYQRHAIEQWINKCTADARPVTSPLTGAAMGTGLKPNLLVMSLVRNMRT